jgi:hypothetical protein
MGPMGADPNAFMGGPGGPAGAGPTDVPPAGELPLYGQVAGPNSEHPFNPACMPKCGYFVGQIHKAAGGPDHCWVDIEENVWLVRSMPFPYPILTTGPQGSTGALGQDGVAVIYGDENEKYGKTFNVFRITGGSWDANRVCGIELSGWISEQRTDNLDGTMPVGGRTVVARPVINAITNLNTAFLIASPPDFAGTVHIGAQLHMGGAEGNALYNLMYCDRVKVNLLGGIRYVDLTESLLISSTSQLPNANDPTNPIISAVTDSFRTHNQFFGGQIGLETEFRHGRFFVDLTGKFAAGNMHERLSLDGNTVQVVAGNGTFTQGGLLVLGSNIGNSTRNEFATVSEGEIKFGYQLTQRISAYIGANALYLSRVMRPGEQINPLINPVQVPSSSQFGGVFGPAEPLPVNKQSDFWAMGGTIGLSIRY